MLAGFNYDRVRFHGINVHPFPTSNFFSMSCLSLKILQNVGSVIRNLPFNLS